MRTEPLLLCSFTVYRLRAGYLQNIKDGVGERLITLNTSVLNNAAFRSAGWTANPADIKRTYSPPIPTAIDSESVSYTHLTLPTKRIV